MSHRAPPHPRRRSIACAPARASRGCPRADHVRRALPAAAAGRPRYGHGGADPAGAAGRRGERRGVARRLPLPSRAAVAFSFFFTLPYESFRIQSGTSVAALLVYVCVSLLFAVLVARLGEARALANRRARNASLLGSAAVEMIRQDRPEPPLRSALHDLVEVLELTGRLPRAPECARRAGRARERGGERGARTAAR